MSATNPMWHIVITILVVSLLVLAATATNSSFQDQAISNESNLTSDIPGISYSGVSGTGQANSSIQSDSGNYTSLGNATPVVSDKDHETLLADEWNASGALIHYKGLETGSMTLISTLSASDNFNPRIDGEYIVWSRLDPVNQSGETVLYDIMSGDETIVTIPGTPDSSDPSVSGNGVAYSGIENGDSNYRIFLYEISSGTTTLISPPGDEIYRVSPSISADNIVWTEYAGSSGQIVLYNRSQNTSAVISPDDPLSDPGLPAISGDYVVWQALDTSNSTYSIWLHRISTNVTRRITPPGRCTSQKAPSISGDRIVYADGFGGEWNITEYDIPTGKSRTISLGKVINNNPQTATDGDLTVWVDTGEGYGNLYLFDHVNDSISLLTPSDPHYSSKSKPSISGDRIVWQCNNLGNIGIHMFTRGPQVECPVAEFSVNQTVGTSPLTVNFKDLSLGSSTAWNWDFGDGGTGAGREVLHTYHDPGLYSVSLTISSPVYRNATRKLDYINIATAPAAGFSTDISSGPAPLAVQFTDSSTGSPTNWVWDFGDGVSDNISRPYHTYLVPGIYSPRLTVANDFGNNSVVKENLVVVLPATQSISTAGLEGLELFDKEGLESIALNLSGYRGRYSMSPDGLVLSLIPSQGSWIKNMYLYSGSGGGFTATPDGFIIGNVSGIEVTSGNIPCGSPTSSEMPGNCLNFTVNLKRIPVNGDLKSTSWDGITTGDLSAFNYAIVYAGFVGITGSAYSVRVDTSGIDPAGEVALDFSVNSSWVRENGGRDAVHVLRKANDGGLEVLPTTFLGDNSSENLDYFKADSPHGLLTFVISSLHGSGNPLQLFYLSISTRVSQSGSASAGGGGGGGGGSYGGSGNKVTAPAEPDTTTGSLADVSTKGPTTPASNNDGQSPSAPVESVSTAEPPANPLPQVTNAPPAHPPVLPPQPTNSIFTLLIEAAAMVSVILIVVFSVSMRYRKRENE